MSASAALTVLLISPDPAVRSACTLMLGETGISVRAGTADEAQTLAEPAPDLILVDSRNQKGNCCGVCREIHRLIAPRRIPVVHLVSEAADLVYEESCPIGLRVGNVRWPTTARILHGAVLELLASMGETLAPADSARLAQALSDLACYELNREGIVVSWSSGAEHLYGYPAQAVLGRFLPIVGQAYLDEFWLMLAGVLHGRSLFRWDTVRITQSGRLLAVRLSMYPLHSPGGAVERIQVVASEAGSAQAVQDELERLSAVVLASGDVVCVARANGQIDFLNPAGYRLLGRPLGSALSQCSLADLFPDLDAALWPQILAARADGEAFLLEQVHFPEAPEAVQALSVQVVRVGGPLDARYALIGRDVSQQQRNEQRLRMLNRTYDVLSRCHQAIMQAGHENDLLQAICNLLTHSGGYRFVMVSLIEPNPDQWLAPAAWSGDEQVQADELRTSWNPDVPRGQGPTGQAVRTGQIVTRNDLGEVQSFAPWSAFKERLGLRAVTALPLSYGYQNFGALSIYSSNKTEFDHEELRLLSELAGQLSYGLHSMRAERARQRAEGESRLFAGAIASTQNGIMITDAVRPDHPVVYVNSAFTRITGWEAEDIVGQSGRILLAGDLQQPEVDTIRRALRARSAAQATVRCYRKDGQAFWNELSVSPVRDADQVVTHFVSVFTDISARIHSENQLNHLATHDPLTGLANRALLNDRLRLAIDCAQRDGGLFALLLVDVDRFKQINDTFGHDAGDILLQTVAARLQAVAPVGDTVARLGSDEFVLLLTNLESEAALLHQGQALLERLRAPVRIGEESFALTLSIGAALFPLDAKDPESLLRLADLAMREVKESGRNAFRSFVPEMGVRSVHALGLEKDLRRALERDELLLYYQPKADLYSGQLAGAEALIRWRHPERGLVSPVQFIPLAEASGLIVPIGRWVLQQACRQARAWQEAGIAPLRVAVNLSAVQFRQGDLVETVEQALAESGLEPCWLELEVTESMVMNNPETAADVLRRLKDMGIRLAMDDFGTGYSSLGYLKRFPFDVLKIDRSFVQNIVTDPDDAVIAVAVIAMAHSLGLHVIAEGVETEGQMHYLRSHLCDELQGYLFSPPLPAAELETFLRAPKLLSLQGEGQVGQTRSLLLVDDEPDVLAALKRLLRRSGYQILTAASAQEGLDLLSTHPVQVIVSDQRMPGMSGVEFLARVKTLYPDTMRIVLSGYTELQALTEAINRGAVYKYVTKPWDDQELREVIREAFVVHEERVAQHKNG